MNNNLNQKFKVSPVLLAGVLIVVVIFIIVAGATLFSTSQEEENNQNITPTPSSSENTTSKTELDYNIDELDQMISTVAPDDFDNSDISNSALGV